MLKILKARKRLGRLASPAANPLFHLRPPPCECMRDLAQESVHDAHGLETLVTRRQYHRMARLKRSTMGNA